MRILWGRANSSNVMKAIWTCEELGIPYERRDVGGPFGGTDTPEYRAMNPNGTVPTLQEDGFVLWESNAVCRYLGSAHGGNTPMWPADPRARASIDRWMDWQQTVLNRPMTVVFQGLVRTPPEKRDAAAIAQAAKGLAHTWGLLDAVLARVPFVAGPAFTLADVALGVHVHRWFTIEFEKPELGNLRAWYGRLLERGAYRQHVAGPVT